MRPGRNELGKGVPGSEADAPRGLLPFGSGDGDGSLERDAGSPNLPKLGRVSMSRSAGSNLGVGEAAGMADGLAPLWG